jgi:hypothetical protein
VNQAPCMCKKYFPFYKCIAQYGRGTTARIKRHLVLSYWMWSLGGILPQWRMELPWKLELQSCLVWCCIALQRKLFSKLWIHTSFRVQTVSSNLLWWCRRTEDEDLNGNSCNQTYFSVLCRTMAIHTISSYQRLGCTKIRKYESRSKLSSAWWTCTFAGG